MPENAGTQIIDPIVPKHSADNYPTHYSKYGKGGLHNGYQTLTDRNNIPIERRELGMIVYVEATGLHYTLKTGYTNADWEEEPSKFYIDDSIESRAIINSYRKGFNDTGSTLNAYKFVRDDAGFNVNIPDIKIIDSYSFKPLGFLVSNINNGDSGNILAYGIIQLPNGIIDTTLIPIKTQLYCDDSGNLTLTKTSILVGYTLSQATNPFIYLFDFQLDKAETTSRRLWVNDTTNVTTINQNGSLERPYKTIQQAIDFAESQPDLSWTINLDYGTYTDPIVISPAKDFLILGPTRRTGDMVISGTINWTPSGSHTSRLAFRDVIVSSVTINDDTSPATLASLSFLNCLSNGVQSTGTSNVTTVISGTSLASFDAIANVAVNGTVGGDINVVGDILATNIQFNSSCTIISCKNLLTFGCSFTQDIECFETAAQFKNSVFLTAKILTFTGALGTAKFDLGSSINFISDGSTIVNGRHKIDFHFVQTTGNITGGVVSRGAGRDIDVTGGHGYIEIGHELTFIQWNNQTITAPANSSFVVYLDITGTMICDNSFDSDIHIPIAKGWADSTTTVLLSEFHIDLPHPASQIYKYARDVIGPMLATGLATTIFGAPSLQLTVGSGEYYLGNHRLSAALGNPITFRYWYRNGSGGWTTVASQTAIDDENYDDGSGTLAAITAGKYKKDLLFVAVIDGAGTEYHVVYGQQLFDTQSATEAGNNPSPPSQIINAALRLAGVTVLKSANQIASVVDQRPILGQLSTGFTSIQSHALLADLDQDNHPQYQLRSEKDTANGYVGLSASNKINSDLVFATSHITGTVSAVGGNTTSLAIYGAPGTDSGFVAIKNGKIIGLSISMSLARTAGTCTMQILINGVAQTGVGQTIVIDGTNTVKTYLVLGTPINYNAGDSISMQTVTAAFTPTGSDATMNVFIVDR